MEKKQVVFESDSPPATQRLGRRLGACLNVGDVVLLTGNLGGGKTTFVQGVLSVLGVGKGVLSPTFILAQSFVGRRRNGKIHLHHLDFYRLDKREILSIGIEDYFTGSGDIPKGVVLIEWADKFRMIWPDDAILVRFLHGGKATERTIIIEAKGARSCGVLRELKKS